MAVLAEAGFSTDRFIHFDSFVQIKSIILTEEAIWVLNIITNTDWKQNVQFRKAKSFWWAKLGIVVWSHCNIDRGMEYETETESLVKGGWAAVSLYGIYFIYFSYWLGDLKQLWVETCWNIALIPMLIHCAKYTWEFVRSSAFHT